MQHKGWVYISLNEGLDLYEITLLTSNYRVLKTIEEVYCDQLAQIVDELVERSPGMPEAKSCKSCTNTSSILYLHQYSKPVAHQTTSMRSQQRPPCSTRKEFVRVAHQKCHRYRI